MWVSFYLVVDLYVWVFWSCDIKYRKEDGAKKLTVDRWKELLTNLNTIATEYVILICCDANNSMSLNSSYYAPLFLYISTYIYSLSFKITNIPIYCKMQDKV